MKVSTSATDCSLPLAPEEEAALEESKLALSFSGSGLTFGSLATVEMKILLQEVYSRFRTTVAPDMTSSMEIDDQIIASRPKGQKCRLIFTPREI